jgi:glyoxalase family protein
MSGAAFPILDRLAFELVAAADGRPPWSGSGVNADLLLVLSPVKTLHLMTGVLGFHVLDETPGRLRLGVNGGGPGRTIDVRHASDARLGVNGLGTVHHVAMAIGDDAQQLALREALLREGYRVTEVRDRQYFKSIYFREPGGVLFEVATITPGFTVDEDLAHLGRDLKLPPWEEPYRADIERGLAQVQP